MGIQDKILESLLKPLINFIKKKKSKKTRDSLTTTACRKLLAIDLDEYAVEALLREARKLGLSPSREQLYAEDKLRGVRTLRTKKATKKKATKKKATKKKR